MLWIKIINCKSINHFNIRIVTCDFFLLLAHIRQMSPYFLGFGNVDSSTILENKLYLYGTITIREQFHRFSPKIPPAAF